MLPNNRRPPTVKPLDPPQENCPKNELEIMVLLDLIRTDCGNLRTCYEPLIQNSRCLRE
ncbi:MAG: hypothetical protein GY849_12640 [Deltaproteobacteria bacterium]|nr:hypothetical protein [Deltaproteobacteria bacterium]